MSDVHTVTDHGSLATTTKAPASRLLVESLFLAIILLVSVAAAVGERHQVIPGGGYVSSLLLLVASIWFVRQFRIRLPITGGTDTLSYLLQLVVPIASIAALAYFGLRPRSPEPIWMPGPVAGFHLIVIVPLAEELYFRGLLLDHLKRGFGAVAAVLLCSLLFALLHLPLGGVIVAGLLSLAACLFVLKGGSLLLAVQLHVAWNGLTIVNRFEDDRIRWLYVLATAVVVVGISAGGWLINAALRRTRFGSTLVR